eukprot:g9645.t1
MNTIIGNSCLSSLSSWTWRWSCSKVLVQIKQRNIRVDTVTQNALLSWKWGEWTCAIKFLQQMMQQDVPADQCSWNALLSLFDKALQWQHVLEQIARAKVVAGGCLLDEVASSAAISACDKGRKWTVALSIFSFFQRS